MKVVVCRLSAHSESRNRNGIGRVDYGWSRLRCDVYRLWEYKLREIRITGRLPLKCPNGPGAPDAHVRLCE